MPDCESSHDVDPDALDYSAGIGPDNLRPSHSIDKTDPKLISSNEKDIAFSEVKPNIGLFSKETSVLSNDKPSNTLVNPNEDAIREETAEDVVKNK